MEHCLRRQFQSPQWGSNSKEDPAEDAEVIFLFQSPQWGSNSKVKDKYDLLQRTQVSVPAMGK